jgi:hypothetical protein
LRRKNRSQSGHSGHGRTCGWLDPVANDPGWVKTGTLADGAESFSQLRVPREGNVLLLHPEIQFERIVFSTFSSRSSFHTAWTHNGHQNFATSNSKPAPINALS